MADTERRGMTWAEFKKEVEDLGVRDDDEIFYIDTHMPNKGLVEVHRDREVDLGIKIIS